MSSFYRIWAKIIVAFSPNRWRRNHFADELNSTTATNLDSLPLVLATSHPPLVDDCRLRRFTFCGVLEREELAPQPCCKYFPAVTYFPTPSPEQYRRRWGVSLPCSGWERVGPPRLNHQKVSSAIIQQAQTFGKGNAGHLCGLLMVRNSGILASGGKPVPYRPPMLGSFGSTLRKIYNKHWVAPLWNGTACGRCRKVFHYPQLTQTFENSRAVRIIHSQTSSLIPPKNAQSPVWIPAFAGMTGRGAGITDKGPRQSNGPGGHGEELRRGAQRRYAILASSARQQYRGR